MCMEEENGGGVGGWGGGGVGHGDRNPRFMGLVCVWI